MLGETDNLGQWRQTLAILGKQVSAAEGEGGNSSKDTRQKVKVALGVVLLVGALQEDVGQLTNGTGGSGQSFDRLASHVQNLARDAVVLAHIGKQHGTQIGEDVGL